MAEVLLPGLLADAALTLGSAPRSTRSSEDTWCLEEAESDLQLDCAKEQGRRHMRQLSLFTFKRWAFHRSTARYARHMSGILQSRIVRGLAPPILSAGAAAAAVCAYEEARRQGWLPAGLPSLILPPLPFDITSFALSLLLVFRTNTSYERWQQAVAAWDAINTRSRDTLRLLLAAGGRGGGGGGGGARRATQTAASSARWLVAFCRALKSQLTEDSDLASELRGVLSRQEAAALLAARHRPAFALAVLTELAEGAPLRETHRARVDENYTAFEDAVGRCERLLRTPIPLSYTRHTSRFMVIWLACLPLGLWAQCGWGTVPLTVVISFLLLGIEEIGVAIEEPFGILPLEEMCQEMECGLADLLQQAGPSKRAAKAAAAAAAREVDAALAASGLADPGLGGAPDGSLERFADKRAAAARRARAAGANGAAPVPPGTFGLGRGAAAPRKPAPAAAIFDSFDESDA